MRLHILWFRKKSGVFFFSFLVTKYRICNWSWDSISAECWENGYPIEHIAVIMEKNRLTYAETPFTSLNDTTCRSNNRLLAKHWCTNSFRKWMIKPRLWAAFQKVFRLFGLMDSGGSVPVQSRHLRRDTSSKYI